jgi:hypothetical protein
LQTVPDFLQFKHVSSILQNAAIIGKFDCFDINTTLVQSFFSNIVPVSISQLAIYSIFRTICSLPAVVRGYWSSDECHRVQKLKLSRFIEERVRSSLIAREISLIALSIKNEKWNTQELQVKGSLTSGEVTATYIRDETSIEIKIALPNSYPLKNVEVMCTSRIGVIDGRWRRWVLQITQLLSSQDGSIVEAVLMWKKNIEKEFEGVEACPICYCVLHTKSLCLPTLECPTCKNKFHSSCLFKWFTSSGKSKCVLCQQPFPLRR